MDNLLVLAQLQAMLTLHDWQAAVSKTIGDFQSGVSHKRMIQSDAIFLALLVLQI